jgi:hypothetical protein
MSRQSPPPQSPSPQPPSVQPPSVQPPEAAEPTQLTYQERATWSSLICVAGSTGVYLTLMTYRLSTQAVADISWIRPMLWSVAGSIIASVLLSVGTGILAGLRLRSGTTVSTCDQETLTDERDQQIHQRGSRSSTLVLSLGAGCALILTMLDVDRFWLGNLLFLAGALAALAETTTRIRLYRRGC